MSQPSIWRPAPQAIPALSLIGTSGDVHASPRRLTLLLARRATTEFDGVGPYLVRDLWLPASAGSLVVAYGAVAAVAVAATAGLLFLPWVLALPAGLWSGSVVSLRQRLALDRIRIANRRWHQALVVVEVAATAATVALLPVIAAWVSAGRVDGTSSSARSLLAANGLLLPAVLLMLALIPLPTMTGRRSLVAPMTPGTAFADAPPRPVHVAGRGRRAIVWAGALRDDLAGRWPNLDRLYSARAGLVIATGLLAAVAAGSAADAVALGLPFGCFLAAAAWGWTCAAMCRHQLVVADEALYSERDNLRQLGGLAAVLAGLCTGLLLIVGLLHRVMAEATVADPGPPLQVWATHFSHPVAAVASVIVITFAVFVQVLPALPWEVGGQLSVMHRLVHLVDLAVAAESADAASRNRPPSVREQASARPRASARRDPAITEGIPRV